MKDRRGTFGEAVAKARQDLGLTLDEVALSVGGGRTYVAEIELGIRPPPSLDLGLRWCVVVGIDEMRGRALLAYSSGHLPVELDLETIQAHIEASRTRED